MLMVIVNKTASIYILKRLAIAFYMKCIQVDNKHFYFSSQKKKKKKKLKIFASCECLTRLLQKQLTLKIVGVLCISKTNKNAGKEQQSLHTPTRHLHQLYYHKIRKNSIYDMLKKSKY